MLELKRGWFAVVVATALLLLAFLPEALRTSLYFSPSQYQNGQWWLPFSSQWVHLNTPHGVVSAVGLLLLYGVFLDGLSTIKLVLCTSSCFLAIAVYLTMFPHAYAFYAGFSGVLYGLFFWGGINYWYIDKRIALLVLVIIALKILWDMIGPSANKNVDWLGARIAVEVHIAGIVGAVIYFIVASFLASIKKAREKSFLE